APRTRPGSTSTLRRGGRQGSWGSTGSPHSGEATSCHNPSLGANGGPAYTPPRGAMGVKERTEKHSFDVLDLKSLRCFFSMAKHGSLTKAGIDLGISEPAVSQRVKSLEEELGAKLYEARGG